MSNMNINVDSKMYTPLIIVNDTLESLSLSLIIDNSKLSHFWLIEFCYSKGNLQKCKANLCQKLSFQKNLFVVVSEILEI